MRVFTFLRRLGLSPANLHPQRGKLESLMVTATPFDLSTYLGEKFPSLSLGAGLFQRWSPSVRIELGLEVFQERTSKLYESMFCDKDLCVLISQDYPEATLSSVAARRYYSLFSLPALGHIDFGTPDRIERTDSEDGHSILEWAQLPARSFPYAAIFEGIANADHAKAPAVASRVYLLNPATDVLLHMYDDRGLDIIAARPRLLVRIRTEFREWVLSSTVEDAG